MFSTATRCLFLTVALAGWSVYMVLEAVRHGPDGVKVELWSAATYGLGALVMIYVHGACLRDADRGRRMLKIAFI